MNPSLVEALEALGRAAGVPRNVELNPNEMPEEVQPFEGAVRRVLVNAYEQSRDARRQCRAHYGTWCMVCGFNFERAYGKAAKRFIRRSPRPNDKRDWQGVQQTPTTLSMPFRQPYGLYRALVQVCRVIPVVLDWRAQHL